MGNSVASWRAQIGCFACRNWDPLIVTCGIDYTYGVSFQLLCVTVILLLMAGIEPNPGPYRCHFCQQVLASPKLHILHQKIHVSIRNFVFKCPHESCSLKYSSFSGVSSHLKDHIDSASNPREEPAYAFVCNFEDCCNSFNKISALCHHLLADHKNERKVCPFSSQCGSTSAMQPSSFASHLSIKHAGWRNDTMDGSDFQRPLSQPHNIASSSSSYVEDYAPGGTEGNDDMEYEDASDTPFEERHYCNHIARFYLKLEAEKFLAESTVQTVCEGLITLSEIVQEELKCSLVRELRRGNVSEDGINSIVTAVLSSNTFYNTHHTEERGPNLTSIYLRKEFYDKNFVTLKFNEKHLTLDTVDGPQIFYFPVRDTLTSLLKDESVKDFIEDSFVKMKKTAQGKYEDYGDGRVHQKHRCKEDHIELIVMQDAFCCAKNNLGSAATKLNLHATYFTIGNLPPHIRSQDVSMNLCFLVESKVLKDPKLGPNMVFQILVTELKKLETEGVMFNNRLIPVKLSFIVGDNLGSNQLGGFTECFSGTYFCRICTVTREEFHQNIVALKRLRTKDDYHRHLQRLCALQQTGSNTKTFRGVKFDSVFNQLNDFHVTDPRLPPCLGHDLFEGVVSWDLKSMLLYFVKKKKWFTLQELCLLIDKFKYLGQDLRNKPAPVKEGNITLGGHAVQNWTLLRLLPFILEKRIKNSEDEVWKLYLLLKQVVEYAASPYFDQASVASFNNIVKKYLRQKKQVLPDSPLKPKHHFLRHYAMLVLQCGPLIHLWAMRFEARHQFFKRISRACSNTVNVGYTMAKRYSRWWAYFTSGTIYPTGLVYPEKTHQLPLEDLAEGHVEALRAMGLVDPSLCLTSKMASSSGVEFRQNTYLMLTKSETGIDVAKIKHIVWENNELLLLINIHEAAFMEEYGVYEINTSAVKESALLRSCDLQFPIRQSVYPFKGKLCFSLKHIL